MTLLSRVARRYIAESSPPIWMTEAVQDGLLDPKAIQFWRQVAHLLGGHFDSNSAMVYWQTKANSAGLDIPTEVLPPYRETEFEVDSRETVESWHSHSVKSQALIADTQKVISGANQVPPEASPILASITKTLNRYADHTSPSVEFEQDFQFLLVLIRKHLHHFDSADSSTWTFHMSQLAKRLDLLLSKAGA